MKKQVFLLIYIFAISFCASAQQAYFIDGYHGGIYGHLPKWQTRFMVDKLQQYPDWKINLELEPESWDSISVQDKKAFEEFKHIINDQSSNGRIEYVNPSYAQSYLYNISGESVIRQFYYGIQSLKKNFPSLILTTYSSEEPCFTSALPQILSSFGFKYASLKNPETCWGGYTRAYGGELVNWIGSDGSRLITVPRYQIESLKPNSVWETIACNNSVAYVKKAFEFGIQHPIGMVLQDAGWSCGPDRNGPWISPAYGKQGICVNGNTLYSTDQVSGTDEPVTDINTCYSPTKFETWRGYIENVSVRTTRDDWHLSQEDVLTSLVWGSQILQRVAQEVRSSENKIVMTEKIASMAGILNGFNWPKESIDEAWRGLLLAQHHDCWIVPYNNIADRPGGITWADHVNTWTWNTNRRCDSIEASAVKAILQSNSLNSNFNQSSDSCRLTVFNTCNGIRRENVEISLPAGWQSAIAVDHKGNQIFGQTIINTTNSEQRIKWILPVSIPSVGYSLYTLRKIRDRENKGIPMTTRLTNGEYKIESDYYSIIVDPTRGGTIKSLIAKKIGKKEFVDQKDKKFFNELRGNFYELGGFRSSTEKPATIKIIENGVLRTRLEIHGEIAGNSFTETITVNQGERKIDLDLVIDWKNNVGIGENPEAVNGVLQRKGFYNDSFKLQAVFPLNLSKQKLYKNAPFDVLQSKLSNTFFNRWDSIKNVVLLNWVDVTDSAGKYGMAFFSDETNSYSHGENYPLALTLQYSGIGVFNVNYSIQGLTHMKYALVPHEKVWDESGIWTENTRWNEPPVTYLTPLDNDSVKKQENLQSSIIEIQPSNCEISSIHFSGEDLQVRVFNAEGTEAKHKLYFHGNPAEIYLIRLNEERIKQLPILRDKFGKAYVEISMPRFGFNTLLFKKFNTVKRSH